MRARLVSLAVGLVAACSMSTSLAAQTATVTGTVTYRERIALPPTAVFDITLEDVSRADRPAEVIARVRGQVSKQPPVPFEIVYDPARIDPRSRYAVRSRVYDGDRLMFASTETVLVLTQGRGSSANVVMQLVPGGDRSGAAPTPPPPTPPKPAPQATAPLTAPAPSQPAPLPPLRPWPPVVELRNLPATFAGTLPCADCPGIRYELSLFSDDSFFLRRTYVGRPAGASEDDLGSFVLSSDRRVLILRGARTDEMFAIREANRLRKLDANGQEISSTQPYDLQRSSSFAPIEISGTMTGAYAGVGNEGRFVECSTGQSWRVSPEGASSALETAFRNATGRGDAPVLVNITGRLEARKTDNRTESVLVVNAVGPKPSSTSCATRFAALPFENTRWLLRAVGTTPVPAATDPRRQPSLQFTDAVAHSFSGTGSCNRLAGQYQINREQITLKAAGTLMACPGADAIEQAFTRALGQTRRYRVRGDVLELYDAENQVVARFEGR